MEEIIHAESIVKSFYEGSEHQRILDGISLSVRKGEFISVMGPSGSGKSTLLFALSGMDRIDGGSVSFCGSNLTACTEISWQTFAGHRWASSSSSPLC